MKAAIACLAAGLAVACATRTARTPAAPPAPGPATYWQVHAILRDNCEHCHNEDKAKGGLLTGSYAALLAGGEHGETVVPGQSAASRLVQMIEGSRKPRMPYKEDPLRAADVDVDPPLDRCAGAPAPGANETEPPERVPRAGRASRRCRPPAPSRPSRSIPASRRLAVGAYKSVHLMSLADRAWGGTLTRARGSRPRPGVLPRRPPPGRRRRSVRPVRRDQDLGRSGGGWHLRCQPPPAAAPALVSTIQGHTDTILALAFSPDGVTIATAGYDKLIQVWDVATGRLVNTLKEHSDAVYAVAYMAGGRQIVSAAGDRTLKVWDVATGKRLFTMTDALDSLYAVAVHPSELADRRRRRRPDDPHLGRGYRYARGVDVRARRRGACGSPTRPMARRWSRRAPTASSRSGMPAPCERCSDSRLSPTG